MEKFGKDYGDKQPEEAIGILEVLFESLGTNDMQKYLYDSKNFHSDWMKTNRRFLFDIAFNSMKRIAEEKSNSGLLKHLNTYTELIVNHNKAQELYKLQDPEGEHCSHLVDYIEESIAQHGKYPLKEMMRDIGFGLIHEEPEIAIITLEALYEALSMKWNSIVQNQLNVEENSSTTLSIDDLFSLAIYSLDEASNNSPIPFQDTLNALDEFYPEQ